MRRGIQLRIEHDLGYAASIPKVDESQASMVAPGVHPTDKDYFLTHGSDPRFAAVTAPLPAPQGIVKNPFARHQLAFLAINSASIFAKLISSCLFLFMSRNTAVPCCSSSSPMIKTATALSLSARRIWLFKLLVSPSISAETPLRRKR